MSKEHTKLAIFKKKLMNKGYKCSDILWNDDCYGAYYFTVTHGKNHLDLFHDPENKHHLTFCSDNGMDFDIENKHFDDFCESLEYQPGMPT